MRIHTAYKATNPRTYQIESEGKQNPNQTFGDFYEVRTSEYKLSVFLPPHQCVFSFGRVQDIFIYILGHFHIFSLQDFNSNISFILLLFNLWQSYSSLLLTLCKIIIQKGKKKNSSEQESIPPLVKFLTNMTT